MFSSVGTPKSMGRNSRALFMGPHRLVTMNSVTFDPFFAFKRQLKGGWTSIICSMLKLEELVKASGIESSVGALMFNKDGVVGSYGAANNEDYADLADVKLTKDGFGLYSLNGFHVLLSSQGDNVLAVYTTPRK